MSVGPWQILIVLVIVLVLFGGSRLGEIGKGLGEGIKNFKKGLNDDESPRRITTTKVSEKPSSAQEEELHDKES